tara:strand:+ start:539 stop:796 length:258 start_codon:yes stop_codon:yes gene_type:complete
MESNRIIAEFMGVDTHYEAQSSNMFNQYHTSWDRLMPVVKRIVSDVEFDVGYENEYREHLMDVVPFANIEDVYEAVVEFIKNQNK